MSIRSLALRWLISAVFVSSLAFATAASKRPNILFVFTDDQATFTVSGHPDAHPHANTPNMDRLIKEGANLLNSFTVTPVCSPSRASLMTSRYGSELGITDWLHPRNEPLDGLDPKKWTTFPKVLSEAGYMTGLVGKWHLGLTDDKHPKKFGFQYFMGNRQGGFSNNNPELEKDGKNEKFKGLTTDVFGDHAISFIKDHKDKPFFLAVHHRAPHTRWLPVSEEDWEPYKDLTDEKTQIPNPEYPNLDVPRVKKMTREYLASVRSVDRNLGRILDTLDELKLADDTIVIFSSDHGYNMGHNGIWHKGNGHWVVNPLPQVTNPNIPRGQRPNMYDNSLKVPTFVRWPGVINAGTVIEESVSNLDWFPTFLAMAGIKKPNNLKLHGKSITPLLKGNAKNWNNEFFGQYSTKHQSQTDMRALRTADWKLIRDYKNRERDEFYDLKNDPVEAKNLIKSREPRVVRAIKDLDARLLAKLNAIKDPVVKGLGKVKGKVVASTLFDKMDIGPFYSGGLKEWANDPKRKQGNSLALKGISVPLGKSRHESVAALTFDTEMLRVAYAWEGAFLRLPIGRDALEGIAEPRGLEIFSTPYGPGWSNAKGSLIDPRPKWEGETNGYGALPDSWGHYEGLYRHGYQTVFQYRLGNRKVHETHALTSHSGVTFIDRQFKVGPSKEKRVLRIATDTDSKGESKGQYGWLANTAGNYWTLASVGGDLKKGIVVQNGELLLNVPASDKSLQFHVSVGRGNGGNAGRWNSVLSALSKKALKQPNWKQLTSGGPTLWKEKVVTKGRRGPNKEAYVVDTITVPEKNPWNSWIRCSGFDFFSDGRVALCSVSGDVWIIDGVDEDLDKLEWKRFATGLFQPLGLKIVKDKIHVLGRDQITRFHDLNGDDEADFYENFNNDVAISSHYHEYCLNLETDTEGNFYFIKGGNLREAKHPHHGCMLRVAADGSKLSVVATGHRAPNGMSVGPNNEYTSSDNEGNWVPASRVNLVKQGGFYGHVYTAHMKKAPTSYDAPICWLPHQLDNSSGGQIWVTSDKWGPFSGDLLHTSYGKCRLFKVMKEEVNGQVQGGVVQFPLNFESGVMRGRFSPFDGQLYIAGLRVWQSSGARFGAFHRVRYTGKKVYMPSEMSVKKDGLEITFTEPLDRELAEDPESYAVDQWNYQWTQDYGSKMYSVKDSSKELGDKKQKTFGGEKVKVESVSLSKDGKTVFLKLEEVLPVMQMHVRFNLDAADGELVRGEIYNTINVVP
ncbi:sulfatase-like hydrolase/transferase [Verrucomicrobia bacterium]|nr:sulfatase-like hydrolase/transferase [Verrucomicrobiota bacterium]